MFTPDGFLEVGRPPLKDNGLPDHFSLAGPQISPIKHKRNRNQSHSIDNDSAVSLVSESSSSVAEVPKKPLGKPPKASPMHITLYFNHL